MLTWPSPRDHRLGIPDIPAIRFTRGDHFGASQFTHSLRPASLLAPPCTDPTSFLAVGDFYIQASGVSVTLPAAGYDYNSDWTLLLAGLSPAGMTASLAARSLRSPGDPSCAFAPLLDPGRTDVPLPWRSHRCCPRFVRQRRLRTMRISGLTHAASAPALLRFAFRVATHAQGWLPAGWLAFTGRASNPLDHYERFQITWSSPFPVLLTLDSFRA